MALTGKESFTLGHLLLDLLWLRRRPHRLHWHVVLYILFLQLYCFCPGVSWLICKVGHVIVAIILSFDLRSFRVSRQRGASSSRSWLPAEQLYEYLICVLASLLLTMLLLERDSRIATTLCASTTLPLTDPDSCAYRIQRPRWIQPS